jgi:hypothetical protein
MAAASAKREKELERRLQVSDAVMKKLHKRNQALAAELSELKMKFGVPTTEPSPVLPVILSPKASPLSSHNRNKDDESPEVMMLRQQVSQLEDKLRRSLAQPAPQATRNSEPVSSIAPTSGGANVSASTYQRLQQQYNDLMEARMDSIVGNGSTAKINQEVKKFFVVLRKRLHDEMAEREVERQLYNERILALESR